jgi:hypothetical protein
MRGVDVVALFLDLSIRNGPYNHSLMHNATSIQQLQKRRIRKKTGGSWSPTGSNGDMDSKVNGTGG